MAPISRIYKGGRQKGIGKKVTRNVKKVTTWSPKGDRNRKKVTYPLLRPPFCGTMHLHELFRKVRANLCLLPCDTSQEPNRNGSNKCPDDLFILGGLFQVDSLGAHLKPVTLKPISCIFLIFRFFASAFSAFSAFSVLLLCGVSSNPCFCRVRGSFRIFRISAFSPYRVRIADFENPTDRLYYDRP